MRIDDREVDATGSVLDACRRAGADVPAFCSDDKLPAGGHCRSCMVEVDGRIVAACTTVARDGLVVRTHTPRLREYRQDLMELMTTEARPAGRVGDAMKSAGVTGERYGRHAVARPRVDASHPYLRVDTETCIRCQLCVRACADLQGQFVFSMQGRGAGSHVGWEVSGLAASACVACGACAAACPTGAITDVDRASGTEPADRHVHTTCSYCGVGCQLDVHARGNLVLSIDGVATSPVNRGHLCVKGRYAHAFVRHPDRLTTPLVRDEHGVLQPATWEVALARVGREFTRLRGHLAALSSSRCTNEENYLVQKWFRAGLGTHNVDCCARVCHGPTAEGMRRSLGTGAATNSLADIDQADVVMVTGSNTTAAHPVTGARIRQAVLSGTRLIVIDPRRTELADMADIHLQLRPGTNVPLLNSLAAVIVEEDLVDKAFVASRTEGWEAYRAFILGSVPEHTEAITGVPAVLVREAARLYARARSPLQVHGLGMTEHYQGSEGVMLLCNLALLVGAVGRPGVGVNPLRGQNNVQGAADMGCQPNLLTGYRDPRDPAVRAAFEEAWARPLPADDGLTIPRMYTAALAGEIRGMFILGEDVVQTDPNAARVTRALQSLEFLVVQELFLTDTARLAHVVLPGAAFLEKDGTFTNGERRIQRVRKVLEPPGQARADWQTLCNLMAACGYPQPFTHPAQVMDEVARVNPAFAGVTYARLEPDGLQWPVPGAQHPGTPILHAQSFPRPGGRAALACVEYAPSPALAEPRSHLLLITGRVLEHYNNGSMTRRTDNAVLHPRDLLEIHPEDARVRAIGQGDPVVIRSQHGEARAAADVTDRVQQGTLFLSFHFPETRTNHVTGDVVDRLADCPEYKLTPVEVLPAPAR